ncbi:hypothetical protein [Acetobacter malorum]|nr:hypothetical protein [Acetobacter malorum]
MSEMLIDELVVRLGLDTTSLQNEAKQTTQLLDKLRQSAEQTAASTRQASTQATSALARMRGEAVSLLAILSGGRGLNRLLADLSTSAGQTAPRPVRKALASAPPSSNQATQATRVLPADRNPLAQTTVSPILKQSASTHASRFSQFVTSTSRPTNASFGPSSFSGLDALRTDVSSGFSASSRAQAAAFPPSSTNLRTTKIFSNTPFLLRREPAQDRLSHRTRLSTSTATQRAPYAPVQPASTLRNSAPENPLLRPFSRSSTEQKTRAKPRHTQSFSAPETNNVSPVGSSPSGSRTQTEHTVSTALTRLITQTAHRVAKSPTPHRTPLRDSRHALPPPAGPRASRSSLKSPQTGPTVGYPPTSSLNRRTSGLASNSVPTGHAPFRASHTDALTVQTRTLSRALATLHAHAGRALAVQPYLPGSPLLHAAGGQSAPHLASASRPTTTTHIGPVTITVPSGNPQAIAQALQGLGGGDSHTLTSLATIGTV